ncbi:MAG: hypothetical protein Q8P46_06840 [Hyphomicrobiales bacterium]|nr:hypothetical protein [Hyphomicrobiales bacterium]
MKATINLEIESGEDLALLARLIDSCGLTAAESVVEPAPKKPRKPRGKKAEEAPAIPRETVAEIPEPEPDDAEVVTREMVAHELRKFITDAGQEGPRKALDVLKTFGVDRFDHLPEEKYSGFLSKLRRA